MSHTSYKKGARFYLDKSINILYVKSYENTHFNGENMTRSTSTGLWAHKCICFPTKVYLILQGFWLRIHLSIHPSVINCNQFTLDREASKKYLIAAFSSTTIHAHTHDWLVFWGYLKGNLYERFRIMNILKAAHFLNKNDY